MAASDAPITTPAAAVPGVPGAQVQLLPASDPVTTVSASTRAPALEARSAIPFHAAPPTCIIPCFITMCVILDQWVMHCAAIKPWRDVVRLAYTATYSFYLSVCIMFRLFKVVRANGLADADMHRAIDILERNWHCERAPIPPCFVDMLASCDTHANADGDVIFTGIPGWSALDQANVLNGTLQFKLPNISGLISWHIYLIGTTQGDRPRSNAGNYHDRLWSLFGLAGGGAAPAGSNTHLAHTYALTPGCNFHDKRNFDDRQTLNAVARSDVYQSLLVDAAAAYPQVASWSEFVGATGPYRNQAQILWNCAYAQFERLSATTSLAKKKPFVLLGTIPLDNGGSSIICIVSNGETLTEEPNRAHSTNPDLNAFTASEILTAADITDSQMESAIVNQTFRLLHPDDVRPAALRGQMNNGVNGNREEWLLRDRSTFGIQNRYANAGNLRTIAPAGFGFANPTYDVCIAVSRPCPRSALGDYYQAVRQRISEWVASRL